MLSNSQFGKPKFTPNTVPCARCQAPVHIAELSNHLDDHALGIGSTGRHAKQTDRAGKTEGKRRKS